jgi:RNA polymerase sigma-70 factor (ECF subfamily)
MSAEISPESLTSSGMPRGLWRTEIKSLFEQKNTALVHYLMALLHSTQDAREVAQEAYEWLLQHQNDPRVLKWSDPLELLLFGVARGIARNRLDRRRNHDRIQRDVLSFDEALQGGRTPTPEYLCEVREQVAVIKQSLEELPPRCREVFILARIQNVSVEQIAEHMNVGTRCVWRYIARAMAHIQRRVDESQRPTGELRKRRRLKAGR